MPRIRFGRLIVGVAAVAVVVAACGIGATPSPVATKLTVGLGFIPSVQFAQFYLADQAGYYDAEGLDITFQNEIDANLVPKVGQGQVDIGMSDGTSVIPAVSQGIPIRYVATVYGQFPSVVFGKKSSGIESAADLEGRRLGIPGRYGSSWIMLQALLASVDLTPDDLDIIEYPDFGQGAAVSEGAVDAATGFANNEPVQLELSGTPAFVLHVDDTVALPGPGLIVGTAAMSSKHDAVAGFVRATLKAMDEIAADPSKGLDAALKAVPDLAQQRDTQKAILDATIAVWKSADGSTSFGAIDRDGWQASVDFMTEIGLVANPVTVDGLVSEEFLPAD
ncbi:MAG TPA: ABC transporter substrate-binding protein [Candidatus Limnocylindrales bacterium]|nr:ABC transporter substrate-binding protein [Candidatus Limnocylindrales bacterium]